MTTHLVVGGTRSGKSEHAERLAVATGAPVLYVATGTVTDAEMAERVADHRRRRPADWTLRETTDLLGAIGSACHDATILIDDLEGWLLDRMGRHGLLTDAEVAALGDAGLAATDAVVAEADAWWAAARERPGTTICVAGQPGLGVTPLGAATRRYVDLHGRVVARLAEHGGPATLAVAGRPLPLPPPVPATPDPARGQTTAEGPTAEGPTAETTTGGPVADTAAPPRTAGSDPRLREHGDRQVPTGALDLAVNVLAGPPAWLRTHLAGCLDDLAAYPDDAVARRALARRHGRDPEEVVPLAGAAEGLWLLPHALQPRLAACLHPGFTEGEAALRAAGVSVTRVLRHPDDDWRLDPARVPDEADLVLLGRPDNPTGVVDATATIAALRRPGRTVVVDEAFAEFLPDANGVAVRADWEDVIAVRSLTKLWGLAGLRLGYLVASPPVARRVAAVRQPWGVGRLGLEALTVLADADEERRRRAGAVADHRAHLLDGLRTLPGVTAWDAGANFVLLRTARDDLHRRLLAEHIATRDCESFPGLDARYLRLAVRAPAVTDRLIDALSRQLDLDEPRVRPRAADHDERARP